MYVFTYFFPKNRTKNYFYSILSKTNINYILLHFITLKTYQK